MANQILELEHKLRRIVKEKESLQGRLTSMGVIIRATVPKTAGSTKAALIIVKTKKFVEKLAAPFGMNDKKNILLMLDGKQPREFK